MNKIRHTTNLLVNTPIHTGTSHTHNIQTTVDGDAEQRGDIISIRFLSHLLLYPHDRQSHIEHLNMLHVLPTAIAFVGIKFQIP